MPPSFIMMLLYKTTLPSSIFRLLIIISLSPQKTPFFILLFFPSSSSSIAKTSNMSAKIRSIKSRDLLLLTLIMFILVAGVYCSSGCYPTCHGSEVAKAQNSVETMEDDGLDDQTKDNDPYRMYGDVPSPGVGH